MTTRVVTSDYTDVWSSCEEGKWLPHVKPGGIQAPTNPLVFVLCVLSRGYNYYCCCSIRT